MNEDIKMFFNSLASSWDDKEEKKQEEIFKFVKDNFPLEKGMKVLDLGCGTGIITNSIYALTNEKVVGMDLSNEMINCAQEKNTNDNIEFICDDFFSCNERKFDAIIVFNAYPHFIDVVSFEKKAYSMLEEKGMLIIAHNFCKEKINDHHQSLSNKLSRRYNTVEEEIKPYEKDFDIIKVEDTKEKLVLVFKKKETKEN